MIGAVVVIVAWLVLIAILWRRLGPPPDGRQDSAARGEAWDALDESQFRRFADGAR